MIGIAPGKNLANERLRGGFIRPLCGLRCSDRSRCRTTEKRSHSGGESSERCSRFYCSTPTRQSRGLSSSRRSGGSGHLRAPLSRSTHTSTDCASSLARTGYCASPAAIACGSSPGNSTPIEFEQLVEQRRSRHRRRATTGPSISALTEALALWRGPAWADTLDCRGAAPRRRSATRRAPARRD